jgi:poly(glycerol-phosphate) alpha-glucosyltransferase
VTPKKHVLELLEAWAKVAEKAEASGWRLVVVGPMEAGYADRLEEMLRAGPSVHLAGPAYGPERAAAYRHADAFILPSVSEGLPMGALEAMSCGLPSLLTPECNLPEAFAADAALKIGADPAGIASGLEALFAMSEARREQMGGNGRRLVARRFTWPQAAAGMEEIYRRVTSTSNGNASAA